MAIHDDMIINLCAVKDTFKHIGLGFIKGEHLDSQLTERTNGRYICSVYSSTMTINDNMSCVIDAMLTASQFRNCKLKSETIDSYLFDNVNVAITNLKYQISHVLWSGHDVKSTQTTSIPPYGEEEYETIVKCAEGIYTRCTEIVGQINRIYPLLDNYETRTMNKAIRVYTDYMDIVVGILKDCTIRSVITKPLSK